MAADSWKNGHGKVPFTQRPEGFWRMENYWDSFSVRNGLPTTHSVYAGWDPDTRRSILKDYPMEWRDKYTFRRSLRAVRTERGRSSSNIVLADVQGNEFTMTAAEFVEATHRGADAEGYIRANWTFTKKGANYFLVLDEDQTPPEGEE